MNKKPGLFSRQNAAGGDPLMEAPWQLIQSLLFSLPPGGKIPVPTKRSEYEAIRESLKDRTDARAKDSVAFIDFLFKHEEFGNVAFQPELN